MATKLEETAQASQQWARERWSEFRATSPYFQGKVALVAGYLVVVALTILLAPPEGDHWRIRSERLSFGLSFKTVITLENVDNGDYEDAIIEVVGKAIEFDGKERPGVWRTRPMALPEAVPTKIFSESLLDARGAVAPYSLVVEQVKVFDGEELVIALRPPPSGGT